MRAAQYGLVSLLLSMASAAPAGSPTSPLLPRQTIDYTKICELELSKEVWEANHYQDQIRLFMRVGPVGHAWTEDSTFDISPLKLIKSYAQKIDEFQCSPKNGQALCDSQDLGSAENCAPGGEGVPNLPQAVTVLKALANFANHMVSVGSESGKAADEVSGLKSELFEKFDVAADTNGAFGDVSPFVIMGAIFGSLGVTAAGPMAGLTGLFTGFGIMTQEKDTTAKDSNDLEAYVRLISSSIADAFTNLADDALNKPPGITGLKAIEDYANHNATALPALLTGGYYADSSSEATTQDTRDSVKQIVTSAAISKLMKLNNVFVARVAPSDKGWKEAKGKGDLCGEPSDHVPFPSAIKWCEDGVMHVLQKWSGDTTVKGYDKLADYGLDIRDAAQNSWAFQKRFGTNHKYEESDLGYFSDMVNGGNFDLKRMQAWDLPVCDIETVDQPKVALDCPPDWSAAQCEMTGYLVARCGYTKDWPYGESPPNDIRTKLENAPP